MRSTDELERGVALKAIASAAKDLQKKGVSGLALDHFVLGAREKLAEQRPDQESRMKAVSASERWIKANR